MKSLRRHNVCFAIDRLQGVDVSERGNVDFVRHEICALLLLIPNLFLRRKPHEIRRLFSSFIFLETADHPDPSFIHPLAFEKDTVSHTTTEATHFGPDNLIFVVVPSSSTRFLFSPDILCIDPFPWVVFQPKLVIRVISKNRARTFSTSLASVRSFERHS